jgi:hypothetical protein
VWFGHHFNLAFNAFQHRFDLVSESVANIFVQPQHYFYPKLVMTIFCAMEAQNPLSQSRQRPGDTFIPEFDIHGDAYFDVSLASGPLVYPKIDT